MDSMIEQIANTNIGRAAIAEHRNKVHIGRIAIADQQSAEYSAMEAAAEHFKERLDGVNKTLNQINEQLQIAGRRKMETLRRRGEQMQQHERRLNDLRRQLEDTADPRIGEVYAKLSAEQSKGWHSSSAEPFEMADARLNACREAMAACEALTFEVIPPSELEKRLQELWLSVPGHEAFSL